MLQKSNWAGARQLFWHLVALAVTAFGVAQGGLWWLPCLLCYSVLLVFLFTAQHEATHRTAFRTPWINLWLARVVGWLLFNPALWFQYFHLAHHRHTRDPLRDPELAGTEPDTLMRFLWHVLGWQVMWSGWRTVVRNGFGRCDEPWLPMSQRAAVARESRVMIALYVVALCVSVALGSWWLVEYWLLPLVLGQPVLRLYLMAEHGRCPAVSNMFENTRTTFTNALIRRIAWNMPYHSEHHAFPSVPFHKLPSWHRHVADHLRCTERGYLRFHRGYLENL